MPLSSPAPATEKPAKALRMIFAFDGEHVHLVSQEPVEMALPPSDPVQGVEGHKGFWYDLRDAQDRALYRRVMHNPMQEDVEVFSDDPKQSIARQTAPHRKGVFVVVVPDVEQGHSVTLSSSPRRVELAAQPAREIGRFALRKP
jgi:hypothetical protein